LACVWRVLCCVLSAPPCPLAARPAAQLRATLVTLLSTSAARHTPLWLALLCDVVFAATAPPPAAASAGPSGGGGDTGASGNGLGADDEEDDDPRFGRNTAAPSGAAAAAAGAAASKSEGGVGAGGGAAGRSVREVLAAPHLRTRHFAGALACARTTRAHLV
jgi:hypothetical protein